MAGERTLTAMYDTEGAARSARDGLLKLGIPRDAIHIRAGSSSAAGATAPAGSTATEDRGFWAELKDLFVTEEDSHTYDEGVRRGGHLVTVRVGEDMADRAEDVLEKADPVDIDSRAESWRQSGWTGHQGAAAGATGERAGGLREGEERLQVAEEELRVGKRAVQRGGVRVRSYVTERPVEEQVSLRQEHVHLERRPVDGGVAKPGDAVFEERTIEATERGEEAVVDKQARVKEEVAIRKDADTRTETVRDSVREQHVEVEDDRTGGTARTGPAGAGATGTRTTGTTGTGTGTGATTATDPLKKK